MERLNSILLIDDDEILLELNARTIKEFNLVSEIITMNSAHKALVYLAERRKKWPEIIICDIEMPHMNGWQFMDVYSTILDPFEEDPIICIHSNSTHESDLNEIERRANVNMYMTKPLNQEKVTQLFSYCFESKNTQVKRNLGIVYVTS
ncbi:response regulator [Reichenbachiella sp.]|uniref:response regulator n=1 Tax=Reichenbachiella sp. TaxID=2184521 RepID=UPI0032969793